jgi:hypothetical protein
LPICDFAANPRDTFGGDNRRATQKLSLGVTGVMSVGALWQEPLAAALASACERGASAFRLHARTKTVLPFAGSLGRLESAFHDFRNGARRTAFLPVRLGPATLRVGASLSIHAKIDIVI